MKKKYENSDECKRATRDATFRKSYGISISEYEELFFAQGGKCAICGVDDSHRGRMLSVDHDHCSGKIRGLLCSNCNLALGLFKDDIKIVRSAERYMRGGLC